MPADSDRSGLLLFYSIGTLGLAEESDKLSDYRRFAYLSNS
jgi:hypothetical protein